MKTAIEDFNAVDPLDRVIKGVEKIAAYMGESSKRQGYHALQKGYWPADRLGNIYYTTPRRLLARVNGEDGYKRPVESPEPVMPKPLPKSLKKKLRRGRKAA